MWTTTPGRPGVLILLILCVLHPNSTSVVQGGVTIPIPAAHVCPWNSAEVLALDLQT